MDHKPARQDVSGRTRPIRHRVEFSSGLPEDGVTRDGSDVLPMAGRRRTRLRVRHPRVRASHRRISFSACDSGALDLKCLLDVLRRDCMIALLKTLSKNTQFSRDVLLLTRVDKPALLRRLFELACRYSGQVLSYTKMLGQLQDAGNTTTLAHYLDLLAGAGMVRGLPKYAGDVARSRGSSPKLQVYNTALMTVPSGFSPDEARADHEFRGRLIESAVGAHLTNASAAGECELYYWRDRGQEVDFIVRARNRLVAIEVKSGRAPQTHAGTAAFAAAFKVRRSLLVGGDGIPVEDFLTQPVAHWVMD